MNTKFTGAKKSQIHSGAVLEISLISSKQLVVVDFCSTRTVGSLRRVSSDAATQIFEVPNFLKGDQKKVS